MCSTDLYGNFFKLCPPLFSSVPTESGKIASQFLLSTNEVVLSKLRVVELRLKLDYEKRSCRLIRRPLLRSSKINVEVLGKSSKDMKPLLHDRQKTKVLGPMMLLSKDN